MRLSVELAVERRALAGDPFRLEAGFETGDGITVACGASGSGKSTLLLAVLGALRPDSGRVCLADTVLFDSTRGTVSPTSRWPISLDSRRPMLTC